MAREVPSDNPFRQYLPETVEAFRVARARASVAQYMEQRLLHVAVYDAKESGLSVRETAALLRVPSSTVGRHWHDGHRCDDRAPLWGTPEEYLAAQMAIWAHAPTQMEKESPFTWSDAPDGSRIIRQTRAPSSVVVVDIDGMARRILQLLHPEIKSNGKTLRAAREAVRNDVAGAEAILAGALDELDPDRRGDLGTRGARGYYLGKATEDRGPQ